MMLQLPDELILLILSKAEPVEVARAQGTCRRLARLGRDTELWKVFCFEQSSQRASRRRKERLQAQEACLAALSQAASNLTRDGTFAISESGQLPALTETKYMRDFAEWDPSRGNHVDFFAEYKARHGPIKVRWFQAPCRSNDSRPLETTGAGVLYTSAGAPQAAIAPMEDGSICFWALSDHAGQHQRGCAVARSRPGLLSLPGSRQPPAFEGAVENVTIDSQSQKAYFAVQDRVVDVDLSTMQVVRSTHFPFQAATLSEAQAPTPVTVGTSNTLHLLDSRSRRLAYSVETDSSHATLSQPGPQSILHMHANDIWVAGRFSSLLKYDRRCWPRIQSTLFSGARLSSLCALNTAHLPRHYSLLRDPSLSTNQYRAAKFMPGSTLVACGEYKGKGSLELYGVGYDDQRAATPKGYQNRQTASKSRLLSVAKHGCRLVYSDGDGELRWVEQDGSTFVRAININDSRYSSSPRSSGEMLSSNAVHPDAQGESLSSDNIDDGDIIQKIIPIHSGSEVETYREHQQDLLLWTDNRLALLEFGYQKYKADEAVEMSSFPDEREEQMRFQWQMRRALERQAAEMHFMQNMGLPA